MKNWIKKNLGRWAYLVAGLLLGAILVGGVAVAQSVTVVEQGKGGRYGAWLIGGSNGGALVPIKVDGSGNIATGATISDIHATIASQVSSGATTTIASPVAAGVIWKVRIQNLGNDEVMIAQGDPPTEMTAHRVQAGGDVWEVEWKGDLYLKLIPTAVTSPQAAPLDTRITVMHY